MAEYKIKTATLNITPDGGSKQEYCCTNLSLDYNVEEISVPCMNSEYETTFPGGHSWSGSCDVAYDSAGMDQLWNAEGALEWIVLTSTTKTITITGDIVITSATMTDSKKDIAKVSITFKGDGALSESVGATT